MQTQPLACSGSPMSRPNHNNPRRRAGRRRKTSLCVFPLPPRLHAPCGGSLRIASSPEGEPCPQLVPEAPIRSTAYLLQLHRGSEHRRASRSAAYLEPGVCFQAKYRAKSCRRALPMHVRASSLTRGKLFMSPRASRSVRISPKCSSSFRATRSEMLGMHIS